MSQPANRKPNHPNLRSNCYRRNDADEHGKKHEVNDVFCGVTMSIVPSLKLTRKLLNNVFGTYAARIIPNGDIGANADKGSFECTSKFKGNPANHAPNARPIVRFDRANFPNAISSVLHSI